MSEDCQILNLSKCGWNHPEFDCGEVSLAGSELPLAGDTTSVTSSSLAEGH